MYILGLTGGIGSGKSTVASLFQKHGVPVICADKIVHHLYSPGSDVYDEICGIFDDSIFNEDKTIDRNAISEILRNNPFLLEKLEKLLHPRVRQEIYMDIDYYREQGEKMVLVDIPLMYQTGGDKVCNSVAVCSCNEEERKKRTLSRPGMTEKKWEMIVANQMTKEELERRADHIIETDISLEKTEEVVKKMIDELQ